MGNELSTIERTGQERFFELMEREVASTSAEVKELAALVAEQPDLWPAVDLSRRGADFANAKEAGGTRANRALQLNLEVRINELSNYPDSPLEHLLVEHVSLCLLRLQHVEHEYNAVMRSEDTTVSLGDYWERRLGAAQRRFLRATETLVRLRRWS